MQIKEQSTISIYSFDISSEVTITSSLDINVSKPVEVSLETYLDNTIGTIKCGNCFGEIMALGRVIGTRASHRNRKHTAIRVFYTGTCTVPFGLAVQYLTAVTNTDVYRIDQFNLLPYYGIYGTIRVDLNFYFHSISTRN